MKPVYVDTPRGRKKHGYVDTDAKVFYRDVTPKDMMHKYKAWSLNPDIMRKLVDKDYKTIQLNVKPKLTDPYTLTISVDSAARNGFEETHAGGPTWYITEEHWTKK